MTDYKLLAELLFWISVIMLAPGAYHLTRAMIRYFFYRYVSNEKIIIKVRKGGREIRSIEIQSTGYVVDNIRKQFKAGEI